MKFGGEALRDAVRRARYFSHFRKPRTAVQAIAELTKDVHLIERAFGLSHPRRPFGEQVAQRISGYLADFGAEIPPALRQRATTALAARDAWNSAGTSPARTGRTTPTTPLELLESRSSVRNFGPSAPSPSELAAILATAHHAPSVSDTQAWRVREFWSTQEQKPLLDLQDGNVGIDVIPVLLMVSVDIRSFAGTHERNQMWIDGGIFLQQLLLAVEAHGWFGVPMNLSLTNSQARKIRAVSDVPPWEELIALVAIGRPVT